MAVKLDTYARRAGVRSDQLLLAYELAIERRIAVLRDAFHPDALHPARTVLILLEDTACSDVDVLVASALAESEYAAMRFQAAEVQERFGESVAGLVSAVPLPEAAGDALVEQLVSAEYDVALIALAERLDHARHLHFRDAALWGPFYAQIRDVYLPVAVREQERLAQRLARWADSFATRFLT